MPPNPPPPPRRGLPKGTGSIAPRGRGLRSPPLPLLPLLRQNGGAAPRCRALSAPGPALRAAPPLLPLPPPPSAPTAARPRTAPPGSGATARTAPEHRGRIPRPHPHRAAALGHHPPPPPAQPHPAPPPSPGPHPAPGPLPAAVPGAARGWGSRPARPLSMASGAVQGAGLCRAVPRRPAPPGPRGRNLGAPRPGLAPAGTDGVGWGWDGAEMLRPTSPLRAPLPVLGPLLGSALAHLHPFLFSPKRWGSQPTLTSPSITRRWSPARMRLRVEPAPPAQPPPPGSASPSPQRDADFHPRAPSPPFVGPHPHPSASRTPQHHQAATLHRGATYHCTGPLRIPPPPQQQGHPRGRSTFGCRRMR